MAGSEQSRYECPAEAWTAVLLSLADEGYRIEPAVFIEPCLYEIRRLGVERRGLWLDVQSNTQVDEACVLIDIHWLTKTLDEEPKWMCGLASRIEKLLLKHGAKCLFGAKNERTEPLT
jgi:hypothetical protein